MQQQSQENTTLDFDYILSVGRMNDDVKQFDKLISAFCQSNVKPKHKISFSGEGLLPYNQKHAHALGLKNRYTFWDGRKIHFVS
jgi:N-acetylgalactosamine-N,N'-diacetylbacillosaminyl-diphospho-undecaprenol 4-alpha-N-acetylgalactosaminyltransferase